MTSVAAAPPGTTVFGLIADGMRFLNPLQKTDVAALASAGAPRVEEIEAVYKSLEKGSIPNAPELRTVRGVFYPAVLLSPGLWEREELDMRKVAWRDPLQTWLFAGFRQWAPSWDINTTSAAGRERPFYGQLGYDDEAFSLLIAVTGNDAPRVRERLLEGDDMVCNVEVTGVLTHRFHAEGRIKKSMRPWAKTFECCLHVDLDQDRHSIERTDEQDQYSAYLWQCVAPRKWLEGSPTIRDVFFLWEHTDLASPPAREYGLAALLHKHAYVQERFGELALIQKSAPALPGTPLLATDSFFSILD